MAYDSAMNQQLLDCKTLTEMLDTIKKYYDTDNCKPGQIGKQMFISNLPKALAVVGAKPKNKCSKQYSKHGTDCLELSRAVLGLA